MVEEGSKCCEFANVYATVGALLISVVGLVAYTSQEIPQGPHAAPLQALNSRLVWNLALVFLLNAVAAGVVCLSTFECPSVHRMGIVQCLTKASTLCFLSFLALCSFVVQLLVSTFGIVWFVMVDFLAFTCRLGPQTISEAQDVLYGLGNLTHPGGAGAAFHPVGVKHIKDTHFISLKDMAEQLNIVQLCGSGSAPGLASVVMHFWFACLLTVVSQALMAVALSGEKERIATHDLHESHTLTAMMFG
mmetsp:Transcript_44665/g.133400  ORF Transcript_44665/g.133400 Transcript_44665/m.133400 type:complete len:247 (-) Transcript_44665:209-949(-)